jgi:poly [ADP-ribose] polymerase
MFGKGVYLADISSKSANYCCHEESDGTGLLLLAEAELGSPMYVTTQANYDAPEDSAEAGAIATFGIGQTAPTAWKDAGDVHKSLKGVLMVS